MENAAIAKYRNGLSILTMDAKFAFWSSLALGLKPEIDDLIPQAVTDGKSVFLNERAVLGWPESELLYTIAHETAHNAFFHTTRIGDREHTRWNVACDYAINLVLADAGFTIPKSDLFDRKYMGLSADEIYSLLPEKLTPEQKKAAERGQVRKPKPGENQTQEETAAEIEQQWSEKIIQAANVAHRAGNLGKKTERAIDQLLRPKVNWQAALRRFALTTSRNDYGYNKPNIRMLPFSVYAPSLCKPSLGNLVVALDTSGSINQNALSAFISELKNLTSEFRKDITILHCDYAIQGSDTLSWCNPNQVITPMGGGGTRFQPAFDHIKEKNIRCDLLLYFTDGQSTDLFTIKAPHYPVLWIAWRKFTPPWGGYIPMY